MFFTGRLSHWSFFSNDFLRLPPISELLTWKALKGLIPTTYIALGGINGFIMKAYFTIFAPLLKYIFDLTLSQEHFPKQWGKKVFIVIVLKNVTLFPPVITD